MADLKVHKKVSESSEQGSSSDSRTFKSKMFLDTLTTPQGIKIAGREEQIKSLSGYLRSYRKGLVVPFISVHGKSGTGKSTTIEFVCKKFEETGDIIYRSINLRMASTVFGCAKTILHALGGPTLKSADGMNIALEKIEEQIEAIILEQGQHTKAARQIRKELFVLVLDEFDVLFHDRRGSPSDFVYSLLLIEENLRKKGHLMCIVAICNRVVGDYELDDRVRSRIGSSEVFFRSYSKEELMEILKDRQALAFSTVVDQPVLEYCAELSARDHGDARRAIDLLRRAGEIGAVRNEEAVGQVDIQKTELTAMSKEDVDAAFSEMQRDKITTIIDGFPGQMKLVIAALVRLSYLTDKEWISTSILLSQYNLMNKSLFRKGIIKPLARRRFAEILTELKDIGQVESQTRSEGRYGYHTKYRLTEDPELIGSLWIPEAWDEVVRLKESRKDFLNTRQFQKVKREFDNKVKGQFDKTKDLDGNTVLTEMNDRNWNLLVYGTTIPKMS